MRITVLLMALLLPGTATVAHAGTLCDCAIGKVAAFDIDMRRLPDPYAANDTVEILRRTALYHLGPTFSARTFQSNRECGLIQKIDPALSLIPGGLRWGQARNFAPDGPIKSLDYLFAGEMVIQGGAYAVTVRLEAAVTREVIKAATVAIPIVEASPTQSGPPMSVLSATIYHMDAAGESLAAAFRPVGPLTAEWETRKRSSDPGIARANPHATLPVKPERRRMAKGETIRVDLELTDCDGKLLDNRRIRFTAGQWHEASVPGTTGGSVSPPSVTTDGAGKATMHFTATANSGTAFIRGWYGLRRPSGHPHATYGEAAVVITPAQPPPEPEESIKGQVRDWKGAVTVTVTMTVDRQGPDGTGRNLVKESGSAHLTCQLLGGGDNATCSFSSNHVLAAKDGSMVTTQNASQAPTFVSVSVADGKLTLRVGYVPVTVSAQSSLGIATGPFPENISPQSYVVPASRDPNQQSGSWTDPDQTMEKLGAKKVVTWSLSR